MDIPIASWIRWQAESPAVFDAIPQGFPGGTVRVGAVVADLFALHGARVDRVLLAQLQPKDGSDAERDRLRAVLHATRVLSHPSLVGAPESGLRGLIEELRTWSAVVGGNTSSDERREELARRCLRAIGRRPQGEGAVEAEDRLKQVDAIERAHLMRQAADREARARAVREALARAAEEAAAARAGRE